MAVTPTEIWREPVRGGYPDPSVIALSGRERLERWRGGRSIPPPLFHLTGARPVNFGIGTADAEMPASPWLASSSGLITGGTLAILADIAFGCSVETELPAATPYTTAELSLSLLRPARPGAILRAGGQAIHVGRSVALSEAFLIEEGSERLVAHGTSRVNVFPTLPDPPAPPDDPERYEAPAYEGPDPWQRPAPDGVLADDVWRELSGPEILRHQAEGELPPPPIHHLTGIRPTESGEGTATATLPASPWLTSPTGLLQGGTIAMLADFAMLIAVETTIEAGVAFAGLDLKVNYLRPAPPDGRDLTARAEVVHRGRTLAITRADVTNADGKPVALATGSSIYLPNRRASLGELELAAPESR
jgi:uncharacterized protein (TIGR00369 family)